MGMKKNIWNHHPVLGFMLVSGGVNESGTDTCDNFKLWLPRQKDAALEPFI